MSAILGKLSYELEIGGNGLQEIEEWIKKVKESVPHVNEMNKDVRTAEQAMSDFAKASGISEKELSKLLSNARKDITLDKELNKSAKQAKITSQELSKVQKEIDKIKNKAPSISTAFKALGAFAGAAMIKQFGEKIVSASNETENALIGFNTVVKNTLGAGMEDTATNAVKKLEASLKGSMDSTSIQMAVKNLLNTGFNLDQAIGLIEKNAYMASVNRQGQFANISDAVVTYTEGIKNNNAMLTDSTGISENLAQTLKKQGLSMDMLTNESTKGAVIQAIYNSHTSEAIKYQDAFNKQMEGFQGQQARVNRSTKILLSTLGDFLKIGLMPIYKGIANMLEYFSDAEDGMYRLKIALAILGSLGFAALIIYIKTLKWETIKTAAAMAVNWAIAFWPIAAIAAGIFAVILIIEDLYIFFTGGKSVFGRFAEWINKMWISIGAKIKTFLSGLWQSFKNAFAKIIDLAKGFGKFIIMHLFPVSILFFYYDEIIGFFTSIGEWLFDFFSGVWNGIKKSFTSMLNMAIEALNKLTAPLSKVGINLQMEKIEHRALGGPVTAGTPYIINERGQELFIPNQSGNIINHSKTKKIMNQGGARVTIAPVINISGGGENIKNQIREVVNNMFIDARHQLGISAT